MRHNLSRGPATLRLETHVVRLWIEPTVFDPFVIFVAQNFETISEVVPTLRLRSDCGIKIGEIGVSAKKTD